jgi:hypothetical protein
VAGATIKADRKWIITVKVVCTALKLMHIFKDSVTRDYCRLVIKHWELGEVRLAHRETK